MTDPDIPQKSPYVMEMEPGTYYWCRCGRSDDQPFCDGSHEGTGMSPVKFEVEEEQTVAWCGCKHTDSPPICDGTHSDL